MFKIIRYKQIQKIKVIMMDRFNTKVKIILKIIHKQQKKKNKYKKRKKNTYIQKNYDFVYFGRINDMIYFSRINENY